MDNFNNVAAALVKLVDQHFTPQRTHEHIAIKLHLLSCIIRRAGVFVEAKKAEGMNSEKTSSVLLESLIKTFLRGVDPHGLPAGWSTFRTSYYVNNVFYD